MYNTTLLLIAFFLVCSLCQYISEVKTQAGSIYYGIPNPFESRFDGYCTIKSIQTTISSQKKKTQLEVDEYFSLNEGLTYSLHRDRDDPNKVFALIADGQQGKTYIVRNPDSKSDIECELDHLHHHNRIVFPWQYKYTINKDGDNKDSENQKKRKKRKQKSNHRFIYGVGAVWLNAIRSGLKSNEVGDDSPYPLSNLWFMQENDMSIKFLFDKPQNDGESKNQRFEDSLETSKFGSVLIERKHVFDRDHETGATHLIGEETHNIVVTSVEFDSQISDQSIRENFFAQLDICREHNERSRVFPSLMHFLGTSPQRLYMLEYIVRNSKQTIKIKNKDSDEFVEENADIVDGSYNEDKHRHTWSTEFHTEGFSFKEEAQVISYEGLPENEADFDDIKNEKLADTYLKKFTEREKERSSRHSTVSYHILDVAGKVESCKIENEPLPKDHLMIRPIHFLRPEGKQISGKLTGLGALILNAADVHYKSFSLFKKEISVPFGQSSLYAKKKVKVDEWQFYDKKTARTIHFYFLNHHDSVQHEIDELVRIDIRDVKSVVDDSTAVEKAGDDDDDESLLVRYDIVGFTSQVSDYDLWLWFTPPVLCFNQPADDDNSDDDSEKSYSGDDDEDFNQDDAYDDDKFADDHYNIFSDDDNDDNGSKNDEFKDEGEDFEFEPGKLMETYQFPDFFEFLDGQGAYEIESSVRIFSDNDVDVDHRRIILKETVDLDKEWSEISIYHETSDSNEIRNLDSIYFINYNSETIFKIDNKRGGCKLVDEVEPWLRLFSAKFNYYMLPYKNIQSSEKNTSKKDSKNDDKLVIESNRLPMFGVGALWRLASETFLTGFVGMKKDVLTVGEQKHKYQEAIWSLHEDEDTDMEIEFSFLWNRTRFELDHSRRRDRRSFEMFTLNSIYVNDFVEDTKFKKFKIQANSIERLASREFFLPELCHDLVTQLNYMEEKKKQFFNSQISMPTFKDFVKNSQSYSIKYTISHVLTQLDTKNNNNNQQLPSFGQESELQVYEYYNLEENLGKLIIGTGHDTREVFINGAKKEMYSYSENTNNCKKLATLKALVDFGAPSSEGLNPEFNLAKMYGLAALWIQLSKLEGIFLRITERHDLSGNKHEVRTYRAYKSSGNSVSNPTSISILVTFVSKIDKESKKRDRYIDDASSSKQKLNNEGFYLDSIEFTPKRMRATPGSSFHKTTIKVSSISHDSPPANQWNLPDECMKLSPNTDEDTKNDNDNNDNNEKSEDEKNDKPSKHVSSASFPKIMSLIREHDHFYMKSEITFSRTLIGNSKRLFSMNEWLFNKNIRYKSNGLKSSLDLIIYGQTKESFDISVPFKCSNKLPQLDPYNLTPESNLIEFWSDDKTMIENLAHIYYGPVSLWYLAEKNLENVELVTSLDIAPKPLAGDSKINDLGRDINIETWRVKSPPSIKTKWSYDMYFERMSIMVDGKKLEWHVLQKIEIEEADTFGSGRKLEIDIINYDWNQKNTEEKYLKNFLLPEGYGCKRSAETLVELGKTYDDLQVNVDYDYWMSYEASLEMVDRIDDDELGSITLGKTMLPTLIGSYVRSNSFNLGPYVDVNVHFCRTRYLNGTMTSTKTVYDSFRTLIYQIDRLTGYCKIGSTTMRDTVLEFPQDKSSTTIALSESLFSRLFLQTLERKFLPINRYNSPDGHFISTYELNVPELKVLNTLAGGPVSIIRTYSHLNGTRISTRKDTKLDRSVKMHDQISVKVMMFDKSSPNALKAILNIKLSKIMNTLANEVIRVINVAQCYNDGNAISDRSSKTFVMEYHFSVHPDNWPTFDKGLMAQNFVKNLLTNAKILPTQLDGLPKVTYSRAKECLEVTFKMIEAPTAIEIFKRVPQSSFNEDLSIHAEVKLLPSLHECSKWCDHIECLAMSYCLDRTCRVINDVRLLKLGLFSYTMIDSMVQNQDCEYFFKSMTRSITLQNFADLTSLLVNDKHDEKQLFEYSLHTSYGISINPTKFYEIKDNLDTAYENDFDNYFNNQDENDSKSKTYVVIEQNSMLETSKLESISGNQKLKTTIGHTKGYAECLDFCESHNCYMFSFCKNDGSCTVIEGKGDSKQIMKSSLQTKLDQTDSCSVSMRDYRDKYTKFENTFEPKSSELSLEGYSDIECAALCEASDGGSDVTKFNCLSFDSCYYKDKQSDQLEFKCFLQKLHVMMDQFDRNIFEPKWMDEQRDSTNQSDGKQYQCEHFSKTPLADFNRLANRRFLASDTIERGYPAEKCAVECHQDEECKAFEFCFDDEAQPSQSCYFIKTTKNLNSLSELEEWGKELEKQLTPSKICSIYILKHQSELYQLDKSQNSLFLIDFSKLSDKQVSLIRYTFTAVCYLAGFVAIGSVIQIAYIRIFGRPVIFNN